MFRTLLFLCLVKYASALIQRINSGFAVKWTGFDGRVVSEPLMFEISNIYSRIQCVVLCLQNEACVSVFYRRQHRRCQLHDVLFMSPEDGEREAGAVYYSLTAGDCPLEYVHKRLLNFCYQLRLIIARRDGGLADCTSRGEHFVVIDSEDKQNHIVKQIKSSSGALKRNYFFDGSDAANEGKWILHDGRPMTYFAWAPGYPTNDTDGKDYITAHGGDMTYRWHDRRGRERKWYVCQKDLWIN
ncbi:uncharacterized protein [Haliotis asinina]|uniref:uncharacterized protein n=1 Tax=Haliotis asinina TaxID=109174 RepID=UPI003532625B